MISWLRVFYIVGMAELRCQLVTGWLVVGSLSIRFALAVRILSIIHFWPTQSHLISVHVVVHEDRYECDQSVHNIHYSRIS